MDCEACNTLLIDYLYDELDEVRRAAVRKHLDGCTSCSDSCERLSRGRHAARSLIPIEAPAPNAALLEAIQAAAAANAAPPGEGHGASVAPVVPIDVRSRIPRWMRRVGEMAMRRQVAMAAVFLLMIGFGLSYHQPQAPTRPLQTSDEPSALVIPATELPAAEAPTARGEATPPSRRPAGARPVAVAERTGEHRAQTAPRPVGNTQDGVAATAPIATAPPAAEGAVNTDDLRNAQAPSLAGRGAGSLDPPVAYRNLPQTPAPTPANVASAQRVTGDTALDRGLPRLPLEGTTQALPSNAYGSQGAQQPAPSWRALRDRGESFRARGETDQAVVALRDALALDPPDADRAAIARSLYSALMQSGQVREAGIVQARYLARPTETTVLADDVNGPSQASTPSNSRPTVSRPMPSRASPARSRRVPAQSDSYNNLGF